MFSYFEKIHDNFIMFREHKDITVSLREMLFILGNAPKSFCASVF